LWRRYDIFGNGKIKNTTFAALFGVLAWRAEIIPVEPDADNAAVGNFFSMNH
jgi:hypothetical protein